MRLANPIYECMPLVYSAIGALGIAISYLDPAGPRSVNALSIGLLAEVAALTVFLRRQDHRARRLEYSGEQLGRPPGSISPKGGV